MSEPHIGYASIIESGKPYLLTLLILYDEDENKNEDRRDGVFDFLHASFYSRVKILKIESIPERIEFNEIGRTFKVGNRTYCCYYLNEEVPWYFYYKPKEAKRIKYWSNGRKRKERIESNYHKGLKEGEHKKWHPDGKQWFEVP